MSQGIGPRTNGKDHAKATAGSSAADTPATAIPAFLRDLERWILWREVARKGKRTKIPCGLRHGGKAIDVTQSANWGSYAEAIAAIARAPGAWSGPGIVLGDLGDGTILCGLDLDTCLNPHGELSEWAKRYLIVLADAYVEISPSNTGLKVFFRILAADFDTIHRILCIDPGKFARKRVYGDGVEHPPAAELFLSHRFFAITGQEWLGSGGDVALLPLETFHTLGELFGPRETITEGRDDLRDTTDPDETALRNKIAQMCRLRGTLRERWGGSKAGLADTSRSGFDMSLGAMLKAAGFTYGEMRAALILNEHGAGKEQDERYFERIWQRSATKPPPEPPPADPDDPGPQDDPDKRDSPQSGTSGMSGSTEQRSEPVFDVEPWNPWDDPPPPDWPGGVLPRAFEDTLAGICLRDGLDFPALAMSYITAASGAAPKDARFYPFQGGAWRVPPIIWLMLVAESGQRKTQTIDHALSMIKQRHGERWRDYRAAMNAWKAAAPGPDKPDKPAEPAPHYTNDITVERLQQLLAEHNRGLLYCRDELASLLDFGRYSQGKGDGARAFFLEAYEAGAHTVHRVSRDTVYIHNAALTIMGGVQPHRLAAFKGLEDDGMLQRFAVVRAGPVGREQPAHIVKGKELIDQRLDQLLAMPFAQHRYHTDAEGAALISSTREVGEAHALLPDFGIGFQGYANKLHGTHARLALILHMLELPERSEIPMETVERAGRLTVFLLRHAAGFYSSIPGSAIETTRAVASLLLRFGQPRVLASDLTKNVRPCRGMGLKDLAPALAPLVAGGWIAPEDPFPDNRAWLVTPGLPALFHARTQAERERAAEARRLIRGLFPKPP